jgi:hydrogenase expression/formation protein HypE
VQELINNDVKITALRDATRGGVSAVLNEWAKQSDICIEVEEDKILVSQEVFGICEMLGFEATALANEGTFCLAVKKDDSQKALEVLKQFNKNATILAKVTNKYKQKVILIADMEVKDF